MNSYTEHAMLFGWFSFVLDVLTFLFLIYPLYCYIKWFGHLQRMSITSLPYRAYNELANSFKAKGRSRTRKRDGIKDTLQQYGLTINDATRQTRSKIFKTPRHR
jgi:hypothetical protein